MIVAMFRSYRIVFIRWQNCSFCFNRLCLWPAPNRISGQAHACS